MRYLSFTFDDALISGAKKVDKILSPYKATFYLTTGWIKPNNKQIIEPGNIGLDHGSIEDWKELSKNGHELGAHTETHLLMTHANIYQECLNSLEFIKTISEPPYSFATTFFGYPSHVMLNMFDSIRIGYRGKFYNNLSNIDFKSLFSWLPLADGRTIKDVNEALKIIPDNSWLILTMHSLDREGFQPISSEELKALKDFVIENKYEIKTVREMTLLFKSFRRDKSCK
jgi:peptidoglycan/xylan/chitin deacetylase (PgdA/CDA1 family)